jgi:hypothetical protein
MNVHGENQIKNQKAKIKNQKCADIRAAVPFVRASAALRVLFLIFDF